jgi:hypothetical protein
MGQVIGRFRVGSVEDRGEQQMWNYEKGESAPTQQIVVKLSAVTKEDDNENFDHSSFYRSTPKGQIEMTIENPDAAEQFQTGDIIAVTFNRIAEG